MKKLYRKHNLYIIMVILLFAAFQGTLCYGNVNKTTINSKMIHAANAVVKAEKMVRFSQFDVEKVQQQLEDTKQQVSIIQQYGKAYASIFASLSQRVQGIEQKVNLRKLTIKMENESKQRQEALDQERYRQEVLIRVNEAENLANRCKAEAVLSYTDFQKAQDALTAALEAVVGLDNRSELYKSLMARVDKVNEVLQKLQDTFDAPDKKPVIYLYPETKQKISVKIGKSAQITSSYPVYPEAGWNVMASPDGTIKDASGKSYYCLYWEGNVKLSYNSTSGFVIQGKDSAAFLENSLKQLGLTEREANEFIIYWLPKLEKNKYNFIHFATEEYNRQVPLEVSPKPDTLIRIAMIYKPLTEPVSMKAQQLTAPERKGFVVVEWGGMEAR